MSSWGRRARGEGEIALPGPRSLAYLPLLPDHHEDRCCQPRQRPAFVLEGEENEEEEGGKGLKIPDPRLYLFHFNRLQK